MVNSRLEHKIRNLNRGIIIIIEGRSNLGESKAGTIIMLSRIISKIKMGGERLLRL